MQADLATATRFCWMCSKKLVIPGFVEIVGADGNSHRVHKTCAVALSPEPVRELLSAVHRADNSAFCGCDDCHGR